MQVVFIHSYVQASFEGLKGYSKKIAEVKDCYNSALQSAPALHR